MLERVSNELLKQECMIGSGGLLNGVPLVLRLTAAGPCSCENLPRDSHAMMSYGSFVAAISGERRVSRKSISWEKLSAFTIGHAVPLRCPKSPIS